MLEACRGYLKLRWLALQYQEASRVSQGSALCPPRLSCGFNEAGSRDALTFGYEFELKDKHSLSVAQVVPSWKVLTFRTRPSCINLETNSEHLESPSSADL